MNFTSAGWPGGDVPPDPGQPGPEAVNEVPTSTDVLPDGRTAIVFGDVTGDAKFNHQQGDNTYGFQGTCGLCSCEDVIAQFGGDVTEAQIVDHAVAKGECDVSGNPEAAGGTTLGDQAAVLADYGIPAHAEQQQSFEDLAAEVQQGHGVIIEANAGYLWHDGRYVENGQDNHAVTVTGVARDPETGAIQGFYINDSGTGKSGEFVDSATMTKAWLNTGGQALVTDLVRGDSATTAA
ncbi:C39 family peptidase [Nocardia sp. alder85J]|uniref:C39 family peptidase n=1 Tax=Nocardia sp. alder85J TaxID=2862949 RepID=UPI001CD1AD7B|nr:C39 family peptidase [Nocardia sp. alder85J]MCX4092341.1 C39 family peptidase [Nocardia sp. alder85J]